MDVFERLSSARPREKRSNDRFESKADLRPRRRYVRFTYELTSSARRETIRNMDMVAIGRGVLTSRERRKKLGLTAQSKWCHFLIAPSRKVVVFQS
jgi:hypothetical protein